MSFVKVWFDFEERTEMLNEVEKGRLLLAMLRYAQGKELPELKGGERFLFPVFKIDIDRDATTYNARINNGAKGGRPKKETEENLTKPNETEPNPIAKNKEYRNKIKEEEQKTKEQEVITGCVRFADFWTIYPNKVKKPTAQTAWRSGKLDKIADVIIADVQRRCETEWKGEGARYVPHPTTYLHQRRWEDETPPQERIERGGKPVTNPALNYEQRDYKAEDFGEDFFINLDDYGGTDDTQTRM
jgi:hypothetical protein